jgi:hypothetical protein
MPLKKKLMQYGTKLFVKFLTVCIIGTQEILRFIGTVLMLFREVLPYICQGYLFILEASG